MAFSNQQVLNIGDLVKPESVSYNSWLDYNNVGMIVKISPAWSVYSTERYDVLWVTTTGESRIIYNLVQESLIKVHSQ